MSHIIDAKAQVCENTELRSASFSRWKLALVVKEGGGVFFEYVILRRKNTLEKVSLRL